MVLLRDEKAFLTSIFGDGVVVSRSKNNGAYYIDIIDYEDNAPIYLYYNLPGFYEEYRKKYSGKRTISRYKISNEFDEMHILDEIHDQSPPNISYDLIHDRNDFDLVLVMSDGILSFLKDEITKTSRNKVEVPINNVLEKLCKFKSSTGEFIKRRCKRFIKDTKKLGWSNFDDVSIAGIHD